MKFIYKNALVAGNRKLLAEINSAAERLFNKLRNLNLNNLIMSDYNKQYFGSKLANLTTSLQLYSYILAWTLSGINKPLKQFIFVDYGGGSGMLSLLAKELGIGTVIYNDIYDVSCNDAKTTAKALGLEADYYVCGDIDETISFLREHKLNCDAIASYDVLEHVYDIESFLDKLPGLSEGHLKIIMASGANMLNKFYTMRVMKKQREAEHCDRKTEYGHKERDTSRAYLTIRKEIIREHAASLSETETERLAIATRGMMKPDIIKSVDGYIKTKCLPRPLEHPTNTCDPYTGNWAEHLMDPYRLRNILSQKGFDARIINGYYGCRDNPLYRYAGRFLNLFISTMRKQGIFLSPFFILYGQKR
jgi:2-polyprenyl-3-methyl-5-hydroxy-6-metoxy-1,4-benzoquinol methylase